MRLAVTFLFILLLFSCNSSTTRYDVFKNYVAENLNTELQENDLFILFPVTNGCNSCIEYSKNFLLDLPKSKKRIVLVYIGFSEKELKLISRGLSSRYVVVYDTQNFAITKNIIEENPVLIEIVANEYKRFDFSTNHNFEKMKETVSDYVKSSF